MAFESLHGRFASLTTWRKSGEPVSTPVWFAVADGNAYVVSRGAGKVKRIRNNPNVELAPCTSRGRATGAPIPGTARILDPELSSSVRRAFRRKYGPLPAIARTAARALGKHLDVLEVSPRRPTSRQTSSMRAPGSASAQAAQPRP